MAFLLWICFLVSIDSLVKSEGTIIWDIARTTHEQDAKTIQRSLDARTDAVVESLGNGRMKYSAIVTIGTPPQTLVVLIDTGSADVWIPDATPTFCETIIAAGCPPGIFNSSQSSTFTEIQPNGFKITYVDNTTASGDYFQDTLSIGGASIPNFEMGLATRTSQTLGVMGISYKNSEIAVLNGKDISYPNLPSALANARLTNANAFSLWLNDLQASTGSILFGGIDTTKYIGDLTSVEILPDSSGNISSFRVAFTSLSITSSSGTDQILSDGYALPVVLDSGTTNIILPNDIAQAVFNELDAYYDKDLGWWVVPCSLRKGSGSLNFGFGHLGPTINVPFSEITIPTYSNNDTENYSNGAQKCLLLIEATAGDLFLFGDSFLRNTYAVYDMDNNRIALAQAQYNITESNIVPFASKGAAIPGATSAPDNPGIQLLSPTAVETLTIQTTGLLATSAFYPPGFTPPGRPVQGSITGPSPVSRPTASAGGSMLKSLNRSKLSTIPAVLVTLFSCLWGRSLAIL